MRVFGWRIPMMASLLAWVLLWEIAGRAGWSFLIPPFTDILASLGKIAGTQTFREATILTLRSFAIGMALAVAAGVPLGILMGRVRAADRLLGIWVDLFVSAPLTALVPVLMILFGFGEQTIVITVFLFAVWIIALDTRAGVRHISPSLVEMGRSFGARRWALHSKVIFWAALPEILAGIRVGCIRGVKGVVIGQLLVSIIGYGALFELYSRNFLMKEFWALTILLFAFAILLSEGIALLEKRVEFYAGVRS